MAKTDLTAERLHELLHYSPETGIFTWRKDVSPNRKRGSLAGSVNWKGYIVIRIDGSPYRGHQLAWVYINGRFPFGPIDHINTIKADNRICNLREATDRLNKENQISAQSNNRNGLLGVAPTGNRFRAQIGSYGKQYYLGTFDTPELAHAAYLVAKRKKHEGCTI